MIERLLRLTHYALAFFMFVGVTVWFIHAVLTMFSVRAAVGIAKSAAAWSLPVALALYWVSRAENWWCRRALIKELQRQRTPDEIAAHRTVPRR